jgi:hypothetical protein
MDRRSKARTGWAIALVGGVLALVAGFGYVVSDGDPQSRRPQGEITLERPTVPLPDKPQPTPMPDVTPIGPR